MHPFKLRGRAFSPRGSGSEDQYDSQILHSGVPTVEGGVQGYASTSSHLAMLLEVQNFAAVLLARVRSGRGVPPVRKGLVPTVRDLGVERLCSIHRECLEPSYLSADNFLVRGFGAVSAEDAYKIEVVDAAAFALSQVMSRDRRELAPQHIQLR